MDHGPPLELIESTHSFPGIYQIKAIGRVADEFESRVLDAVRGELRDHSDLAYSVRSTPNGRHISVTLDITVESAEQVRTIYSRIHGLEGLMMLL